MEQQRRSHGKYDLYSQKNWTAGLLTADFFFYVWLFFLLAVVGWLWEGFLYLFKDDM